MQSIFRWPRAIRTRCVAAFLCTIVYSSCTPFSHCPQATRTRCVAVLSPPYCLLVVHSVHLVVANIYTSPLWLAISSKCHRLNLMFIDTPLRRIRRMSLPASPCSLLLVLMDQAPEHNPNSMPLLACFVTQALPSTILRWCPLRRHPRVMCSTQLQRVHYKWLCM